MNKNYFTYLAISAFFSGSLATGNDYYGYRQEHRHNGKQEISDTEKAVAGVVVGALAIAAAKSLSNTANAATPVYPSNWPNQAQRPISQLPLAPPSSGYQQSRNIVIVNIRKPNGNVVPIYLNRKGTGFIGPRGEYYTTMPSTRMLTNIYGRPKPMTNPSRPLRVSVEQRRVKVLRGQQTVAVLRPSMANVEKYKLVNNDREIIIKSRGDHGPAIVEKFNLHNGTLNDKVMAFAIRKGGAAWAKGMED